MIFVTALLTPNLKFQTNQWFNFFGVKVATLWLLPGLTSRQRRETPRLDDNDRPSPLDLGSAAMGIDENNTTKGSGYV